MGKQLTRPLRPEGREGFSLVEVAIVTVLLLVAVGGLSGAVLSSLRLSRATEESARADEAVRALAGRIHNDGFGVLFQQYNADPSDDLLGAGKAPGAAFDVPGLTARPDDPDGHVGRIVFPTVDLLGGKQALREDVVDERLGMLAGVGRDLNGNGELPNDDQMTVGYVILPARLIVEWTGAGGDRSYELDLVFVP